MSNSAMGPCHFCQKDLDEPGHHCIRMNMLDGESTVHCCPACYKIWKAGADACAPVIHKMKESAERSLEQLKSELGEPSFWYTKYWLEKDTEEFADWFETEYGVPKDFADHDSDPDEYWRRRGFALMGWLARMTYNFDPEAKCETCNGHNAVVNGGCHVDCPTCNPDAWWTCEGCGLRFNVEEDKPVGQDEHSNSYCEPCARAAM